MIDPTSSRLMPFAARMVASRLPSRRLTSWLLRLRSPSVPMGAMAHESRRAPKWNYGRGGSLRRQRLVRSMAPYESASSSSSEALASSTQAATSSTNERPSSTHEHPTPS